MLGSRQALGLLAGVVLCLVLGGCSFSFSVGDDSSPTEALSEQIESAYEDRAGIALRSLECEEVEAEKGAAISCEGQNANGVELWIDGRVTGVEGSDLDYHWDVARAVAPGSLYAEAAVPMVERLAGGGIQGVRCQRRVRVEVGALVACEAQLASGQIVPVRLRITDADGGFDLVPPRNGSA